MTFLRRVDEERQRQEQMAMARKLQEQGGGVPNQRGGNGMFDQSIQVFSEFLFFKICSNHSFLFLFDLKILFF